MASCAPKRGRHRSSSACRLGRMDGHAARSVLVFLCIHIAHRSRRTAGNAHHCRRTPNASTTCHLSRTGSPTRSCRPNYFRVRTRDSGFLRVAARFWTRASCRHPSSATRKRKNRRSRPAKRRRSGRSSPRTLRRMTLMHLGPSIGHRRRRSHSRR
jgi:hypothetical protein